MTQTKNILPSIVEGIQDKKGQHITVLDLSGIEMASTGFFVICEGRSPSQVAAIADSIRDVVLEKAGRKPYNYDGYRNSQWIVVDYGEIMVHIFIPEAREHYNIEELWGDSTRTDIPDLD